MKWGLLINNNILAYILYADDLILCSETAEGLPKFLNGLFEFCKKKWHLTVSLAQKMYLFLGREISKINSYLIGLKLISPLSINMWAQLCLLEQGIYMLKTKLI